MFVSTANSGVVVTLESRSPNEPHARGVVLSRGGGVPWLQEGMRVLYPIAEATELRIDPEMYMDTPGITLPGIATSSDGPSYRTVYLVDQRHIHATIHG